MRTRSALSLILIASAALGWATAGESLGETLDVPMFRGNPAHTGEMPGPGPDASGSIVERWRFATGEGIFSSPAVVDGVVYVGSLDNNIYALDAASGAERWRFATGDTVSSSPAVVGGVVYVGSTNVYALGNPSPEMIATEQAVQTAEAIVEATTAAQQAIESAWSGYFSQLGSNLSESDRLPDGFAVSPAVEPAEHVWSVRGWARGTSYPVDLTAAEGDASAIDVLIFGSKDAADEATAAVVNALQRAAWPTRDVEGIDHDHTCLTIVQGGQAQAVCFVLRDDTVIVTSSLLPLDAPDVVLLNAVDLAIFANGIYDEVARPAGIPVE